jgi:hypothetical protein
MKEIVNHAERCIFCRKRKATILCDFISSYVWTSIDFERSPQTCDRQMCDECATELSEEFHFCPKCIEVTKKKINAKKVN